LPVQSWFDIIGKETIADAILDRLVHASYRIELKRESLRKNGNCQSTVFFEPQPKGWSVSPEYPIYENITEIKKVY
jgi:hypothetical protein